MRRFLKRFLSAKDGAIAVETAIVTPILLFILLPSIDIGMQIHALQKMNKATDSGIEYVVNGGRSESTLKAIVQDSFGKQIADNELSIDAYCGCIETPDNGSGGDDVNDDPQAGFYVKTSTSFSENMCPTLCVDGEAASQLVELTFNREVSGAWKSKKVSTHLQTRIK